MPLRALTLDDLTIEDERSFRHVALYDSLKQSLRRSRYRFRVPDPRSPGARWDRVVFLNLTFWNPTEAGDVLLDKRIPADVVAHVAWHHLTRQALIGSGAETSEPPIMTTEGLLLGESIASAFDLYLVGRLLGHAPDSDFLETQVPAMAETAEAAGLSSEGFEELLRGVATDPEQAFEDLRQLLFDTTTVLVRCGDITEAAEAIERFDGHRFASLLHHYELSNWILFARAYAPGAHQHREDQRARSIDASLRRSEVSLAWLEESWLKA